MTLKVQSIPSRLVLKGHKVGGTRVSDWPVFTWINPGDPPVYQEEDALIFYKQSNSQSTPNWNVPSPRYVSLPKQLVKLPKATQKPAFPKYNLQKAPVPAQKRHGASEVSYGRYLRKFNARLALFRIRETAYNAAYAKRLDSYNQKYARWEKAQNRAIFKLNYSLLKKVGVIVPTTNNPYNYSMYRDSGWKCNFVFRQTFYVIPNPSYQYHYEIDGPGPYVSHERCGYGTSANFPAVFHRYGGRGDHSPPNLPGSNPPAALVHEATLKSVDQLYERIKNSAAHIGNMVAERAQTYVMLVESVARLRSFLHSPKKSIMRYITERGVSKRVGNDYIQYCFGVEPLANDIFALVKRLSDSSSNLASADMVKVRSGGSAKETFTETTDGGFYTDESTVTYEVRVRHMVEYRADNAALATLGQFGLVNPAEIAWEVTPWSFVIDWFFPVGQYISNLSASTGLTFKGGTTSIKITTTRHIKRTYKYYAPLWNQGLVYYGTIERFHQSETKTRTILTDEPSVPPPRFKNPFSVRHVLLSMALWRQRI